MKSIFLGSAIAVAAATGAQAADPILDVKAPREPVYRCDITGFIELPGTDICWKIGGRARFVAWAASDSFVAREPNPYALAFDGVSEHDNTINYYGQARLNFDARTVTEYGTVRAFIEMQANNNDRNTGGNFGLRHAFVQFGNWTFGKTWSTFLHLASSPAYLDPATVVGDSYIRRDQIRYTQSFGNGFAVSVAIEDPEYNFPTAYTTAAAATVGLNDDNVLPDLVGNINYSGDWGEVQVSGALHQNEFYGVTGAGVEWEDDELGWAVLGGLVLNAPWAGEGDAFALKATYTDGATQYSGASALASYLGDNVIWDACVVGDCITDSLSQWAILASFAHNWTPTVSSTIGGGYASTDFDGTIIDPIAGVYSVDNADTWEVFANVSWTPVSRTTFMVDIHYATTDFDPVVGTLPVGFTGDTDVDGIWGGFQVTRSF